MNNNTKTIFWKDIKIGDKFIDGSRVKSIHDEYRTYCYDINGVILSNTHLLLCDISYSSNETKNWIEKEFGNYNIPTLYDKHCYFENLDETLIKYEDENRSEEDGLVYMTHDQINSMLTESQQSSYEVVESDPCKVDEYIYWLPVETINNLVRVLKENIYLLKYKDNYICQELEKKYSQSNKNNDKDENRKINKNNVKINENEENIKILRNELNCKESKIIYNCSNNNSENEQNKRYYNSERSEEKEDNNSIDSSNGNIENINQVNKNNIINKIKSVTQNAIHKKSSRSDIYDLVKIENIGFIGQRDVFCVETDSHRFETCGMIHHNSVTLRNIILHCLTHGQQICIGLVDLKFTEFTYFKGVNNVVAVANTVKEACELLRLMRECMYKRNEEMSKIGINDIKDFVPKKATNEYMIYNRKFSGDDEVEIRLKNGEVKTVKVKEIGGYLE